MKSPQEFLQHRLYPDPREVEDFYPDYFPEIVGQEIPLDEANERDAFKLAQQRVYYYIHQAQARLKACGADRERRRRQLIDLDKILAQRDALDNLAVRLGIVTDLGCDNERVRQLWFTCPPGTSNKSFPVRFRQVAEVTFVTEKPHQ